MLLVVSFILHLDLWCFLILFETANTRSKLVTKEHCWWVKQAKTIEKQTNTHALVLFDSFLKSSIAQLFWWLIDSTSTFSCSLLVKKCCTESIVTPINWKKTPCASAFSKLRQHHSLLLTNKHFASVWLFSCAGKSCFWNHGACPTITAECKWLFFFQVNRAAILTQLEQEVASSLLAQNVSKQKIQAEKHLMAKTVNGKCCWRNGHT